MLDHAGDLFGTTGGDESTIKVSDLAYERGGVSLYGFLINYEVKCRPIAAGLPRLARMVADGTLRTSIGAHACIRDQRSSRRIF